MMSTMLAGTPFTIAARHGAHLPTERDGRLVLRGEVVWLLRGPERQLDGVARALPGVGERLAPDLLLLDFGNAVGHFAVPGLPPLEVVSGKWDEGHFARMLDDLTTIAAGLPFAASETAGLPYDLTTIAAGLPFAASETAGLPYDRSVADQPDVLYHLFVYLRHILSDDPPPERRLLPALRLIVREPHQRFDQTRRTVPAELARGLDPAGFARLAVGVGGFTRVGPAVAARFPAARALRGHLPTRVDEPHAAITSDTPENRFVKAFLAQATGIVARMRQTLAPLRPNAFRDRLLRDCNAMDTALQPIATAPLWAEVGRMVHLPASSPVLQRRRGYREVYGHFGRLRLATRLPLSATAMRDLLTVKDIAQLYELWCYFTLVDATTRLLGPSTRAARTQGNDLQIGVPWDLAVDWPDGTRLLYNPRFSRSRQGDRRSYSVPLRPDIALIVPHGPNAGLHLLDAKFRLDRLDAALGAADATEESEEDEAAERRGTFKRADLYKMHTYRDAIPDARSVWILYPGSEFRFFCEDPALPIATVLGHFGPGILAGVGAVPLAPEDGALAALELILARLLVTG